jgi:hypothetical protein
MEICGYCGNIQCTCISKFKKELTKEERERQAAELIAQMFIQGLKLLIALSK